MFESYPDVLEVKDLCSALRIGRNKAYELLNTEIKSIRIGTVHKIPKIYLIEYIEKSSNPN